MSEWALFNDDSANWTEEEAVEAGFYSRKEAEDALRNRYHTEDDLVIHEVEEADDEDEDEDEADDEDEDDNPLA